ncbi:uncharacterized protein [Typha angustifolia]|uniref:uncharacterized protein isoform X2 n=1 Tax=Typha angustifolia TaxID=59011 RepID=UPI003C308A7A
MWSGNSTMGSIAAILVPWSFSLEKTACMRILSSPVPLLDARKFTESMSTDLQFVIDDISNEDTLAIGVTWHLEWQGRPFPFSKGCSFYRLEILDGKRQIVYGRDCVEPATKPGETALVLIRAVTWILQRFPQLADRL